ncbi:MAG TPA: hypothetical protein VIL36_13260 [Acidimicrobiales bacterium]
MSTYEPPSLHIVDRKLEVVADRHRIACKRSEFPLTAIDRVAYQATVHRLNGAYMGTAFTVKLGAGDRHDTFILDSGSKDGRLDEFRAFWEGVVDLLETWVCPRIAEQAVHTIAGGGRVSFGGIVAGPHGLRSKAPLARTIPWTDVVGTEVERVGYLRLQVRNGSGRTKARLRAGLLQWNTVVLPRVVAAFAG